MKRLVGAATLEPCISRDAVERFERDHGVVVPDDYKRFVIAVGNGGNVGPAYGLSPLSNGSDLLAKPFPLDAAWVWEDEPESVERDARVASTLNGNLALGTEGCGATWILILNGPCRGQVWLRTGEGITPSEGGLGFGAWLERRMRGGRAWWGRLVIDWGPMRGAYFMAHATKKLAVRTEERTFGVNAPLCEDCIEFFTKLAVHRAMLYTIADPLRLRHFLPDGSVQTQTSP